MKSVSYLYLYKKMINMDQDTKDSLIYIICFSVISIFTGLASFVEPIFILYFIWSLILLSLSITTIIRGDINGK